MAKVFALLIVGILVISAGSFIFFDKINNNSTRQETPKPIKTETPAPSSYPGTTEFKSNKLKIAFNYLPKIDNIQFKTLESGNKVYIYPSNMKPEEGQFVEVFEKSSNESLQQTVNQRFLSGESLKLCSAVDTTVQYTQAVTQYKKLPSNYKIVEIAIPRPTSTDAPWWSTTEFCSKDYAQTNGIRYFLEDTNYPDRFVFLSIGQYAISAGENITWQDTFRFTQ